MKELTDEQRANAIWQIKDSAGLGVVMDIIEEVALDAENELLAHQPWMPQVQGLHAIAHANRLMFQEVMERVNKMASTVMAEPVIPKRKQTLEDRANENAELNLGPE